MKPTFTVKRIDRGWKGIKRVVEAVQMKGAHVKAGVLAKDDARDDGEVGNVELALIHEFGAPSVGIPERSFVRSAFSAHKPEYKAMIARMLPLVYRLKLSANQALRLLGEKMASDIKRGITRGAGIPPPNKPATIAAKGSSRPLEDKGQLVTSISYEVEGHE